MELVAVEAARGHADVGVAREREGGPALAAEAVEAVGATAVGAVVRLPHQPRHARPAVQALLGECSISID